MRYVLLLPLVFLAACGVRETSYLDGTITRQLYVGPTEFPDCSVQQVMSGEVQNLGVWAGTDGGGAGLKSFRFACGPPACQVVIWLPRGSTAEEVQELAGKLENVCIIEKRRLK